MRWLFFWFLFVATTGFHPATAQETVVQEFSGAGTTTTGLFKVQDRWEVRWNARQVVSIAVMSADGTIVAGAAGVLRGSLFVPLGGEYYLKVSDGTVAPPPGPEAMPHPAADIPTTATTNAPPAAITITPITPGTNAAPVANTNAASAFGVVTPPTPPLHTAPDGSSTPETAISWHLQIVELGTSASSDQALTVYTPFFMMPDTAVTPVATPPAPPPPVLTSDQAKAVVTIKGDNAQGSGFLMRSPDGIFVVTHLGLLAANPNVKIYTSSGAPVTTLSLKGAIDRDLALFAIQDDHYLPLPIDSADTVAAGDELIIPDIGTTTDIVLGKPGRVIGVSAERIDFDNQMSPGGSGAPVIDAKSGTVLALVTSMKTVNVSNDIAAAWPGNPAPASAGIIPYFGLRLTGVQGWETYDAARFLAETLFLKQFHDDTRCLDSYLNGRRHRRRDGTDDTGPPDNRYFLNNAKLHSASNTYKQMANGADENQRLDADRELLFDIQNVADEGMNTLQGMNLYAFDRNWAQEELAYRKAIKKQLEYLGNHMDQLDDLAQSR